MVVQGYGTYFLCTLHFIHKCLHSYPIPNIPNMTSAKKSKQQVRQAPQKHKDYPVENAHATEANAIAELLRSDLSTGLSNAEASQALQQYGPNSYQTQKQKSIFLILLDQFKSPIVLLLAGAAVLSFVFQQSLEGYSIIAVLFLTAALGFLMELQAMKSMKALKEMDTNESKVWRSDALTEVPSEKIVPGDILVLESGDIIPADARIFENNQAEVDESALTGESLPVAKDSKTLKPDTDLADRVNMVYKGTSFVRGNARAIVTGTGLHTELGKITELVDTAQQSATPLEKKLQGLTQKLIWITAIFAAIFIGTGVLQGKKIYPIIETAIALAVAAIPEGLPIVSTIALTYGMLRMARKKVLIKRLAAVETLGGINTIFTDKTGTLTENRIEATSLALFEEEIAVDKHKIDPNAKDNNLAVEKMLLISVLCNNAVLKKSGKRTKHLGDPLEIALLQLAETNDWKPAKVNKDHTRIAEEPFSSETKLMATLHKNSSAHVVAAKGAVEELIEKCKSFATRDEVKKLDSKGKKHFMQKAEELQAQGTRVLAFAYREDDNISKDNFLKDLTLAGLIGFLDPPRMDVVGALESCREAGIKVIMITGDHPATALHIAEKIKLTDQENVVMNGNDLTVGSKKKELFSATIFARVDPKQKLDMVSLYQKRGDIVAMTGDGINDAPALKKADIGIAMGIRGTQVAKETAAMILKDDSFKSIVSAISQGRAIFQNIKRFLVYLLSCNLSEILIVFLFGLLNFPFSLLPLQILFLNLVTDIFPALALGLGKGNELIMKMPPRNPKEEIITRKDWINVVAYAILLALPVMFVSWYGNRYMDWKPEVCNNITFLGIALAQLWHVFNLPSRKISFLNNEVTRNRFVWYALLICVVIIGIFYFVAPLKKILALETLNGTVWLIILAASLAPIVLIQALKRLLKVIG